MPRKKQLVLFCFNQTGYSSGSGKNGGCALEEKPKPPIISSSHIWPSLLPTDQALLLLSVCLCVCILAGWGEHGSDPTEFWSLVLLWSLMIVGTLCSNKFSIYRIVVEQSRVLNFSFHILETILFVNKGTNFSGKMFTLLFNIIKYNTTKCNL